MSKMKMFNSKDGAMIKYKEFHDKVKTETNNLFENIYDIHKNIIEYEKENDEEKKKNIKNTIVAAFVSTVLSSDDFVKTATITNNIKEDIEEGFYEDGFENRYGINVKVDEYDGNIVGYYTTFRDEYRQWYHAEINKNNDDKTIPYVARIYTLLNSQIPFLDITRKCIVENYNIKESEFNKVGLIKTIKLFLNGNFDIKPDNAYNEINN